MIILVDRLFKVGVAYHFAATFVKTSTGIILEYTTWMVKSGQKIEGCKSETFYDNVGVDVLITSAYEKRDAWATALGPRFPTSRGEIERWP